MTKFADCISRYALSLCLMFSSFTIFASSHYQLEVKPEIGRMISTSTPAQSAAELCDVAKGTVDYLNLGQDYDPLAITAGMTAEFGGDLERIKRTLAFICQVNTEDKRANQPSRLMDAEFIKTHFDVIRWRPDLTQAKRFEKNKPLLQNLPDDKILLTKYYIKLAKGSAKRTAKTPYALYALPNDEAGLSLEVADNDPTLIRHQLTKQQVLAGGLDKSTVFKETRLAEPLVWLSRYDLEDSLMQGTVKVDVDGQSQFYNVHRNNAIGYDRNLKREEQGRYWYFKETQSLLGYGKDATRKIPIHTMVTVAGDLAHLGLGKLIMLTVNGESRLTILADTGGAFVDNQYQLDYLGGYFRNWQDYINTYRTFPDYVEARILLLKE